MTAELYLEFFLRFFVILGLMVSSLLSIALFLKMKKREYLLELLILGLLIFSLLWGVYQFSQIVFITTSIIGEPIGDDLMSKTFALMGAIMIFSISIVKNRLSKVLKNY